MTSVPPHLFGTPARRRIVAEDVDAILARMAAPQEGGGDIRQLMHELKAVVIARVRTEQASEARLDGVRAILRKAAADIEQLD